jgi:hypothetical protein
VEVGTVYRPVIDPSFSSPENYPSGAPEAGTPRARFFTAASYRRNEAACAHATSSASLLQTLFPFFPTEALAFLPRHISLGPRLVALSV